MGIGNYMGHYVFYSVSGQELVWHHFNDMLNKACFDYLYHHKWCPTSGFLVIFVHTILPVLAIDRIINIFKKKTKQLLKKAEINVFSLMHNY